MPQTFVAEFNRLLDAYEQAVHARESSKGETAAARASIASALASGLAAVRRLDVIVANHARYDRAFVAAWARDRRVDYPRGASHSVMITRAARDERRRDSEGLPSRPSTWPVSSPLR